MKNNETLQKDVQDAIKWEPLMNAAEIGVTAIDGVITLSGTVNSYLKKRQAENAAKNVSGVKAVIENILVHFECDSNKPDVEIASEVIYALKCCWEITSSDIQVKVDDGWVTLFGEQQWNFQKQVAINTINNLSCVKGVINNITLKTNNHEAVRQIDLERALERNWSIDDKKITVAVDGNKVTLSGIVNSLYQKDEAEKITWNGAGVWTVENNLVVELK